MPVSLGSAQAIVMNFDDDVFFVWFVLLCLKPNQYTKLRSNSRRRAQSGDGLTLNKLNLSDGYQQFADSFAYGNETFYQQDYCATSKLDSYNKGNSLRDKYPDSLPLC